MKPKKVNCIFHSRHILHTNIIGSLVLLVSVGVLLGGGSLVYSDTVICSVSPRLIDTLESYSSLLKNPVKALCLLTLYKSKGSFCLSVEHY